MDDEIEYLSQQIDTTGEFNYAVTTLATRLTEKWGVDYSTCSRVRAVFTDASDEYYRRLMAPYEDKKIEANGDVVGFPAAR